jgi:hypothetical protein
MVFGAMPLASLVALTHSESSCFEAFWLGEAAALHNAVRCCKVAECRDPDRLADNVASSIGAFNFPLTHFE